jgi:hypothetical protein
MSNTPSQPYFPPLSSGSQNGNGKGSHDEKLKADIDDFVWLINNANKSEFDRVLRLARLLSAKPYHVLTNPGGVK